VSGRAEEVAGAYEGVEDLASFSADSLAAYREQALARTAAEAEFIRRRLTPGGHVLEVGSGNGRLLLTLAAAGAITRGTGLEIASSRTAFAQRWAGDEGVAGMLDLRTADALTSELPAAVDAAVCVTGAFSYFDAIRPGAASELLHRLRDALAPGGLLVLELYPHPQWVRLFDAGGDELRVWQEMPASDPWRFYLSHLTLDRPTGVLSHHKTFVHRTEGTIDDTRREHLRLYDEAAIRAEVSEAGFAGLEVFGGWEERPPGEDDEILVVAARRP
jgi:SAM-dependent methyltransferase